MQGRLGDVLSIIEAAYVEAASIEDWIHGVLAALRPSLDHGDGVLATRFQHTPEGVTIAPLQAMGHDPTFLDGVYRDLSDGLAQLPARWGHRMFPLTPMIVRSTELVPVTDRPGPARVVTERFGTLDSLGVVAGDPSGHGCIFWTRELDRPPLSARVRAVWSRIATHLATGYRLARAAAPPAEAVLDPSGRVLHRERPVTTGDTEVLREATRRIERARGRMRRVDPERALELWQGLVVGRWSLVDHFDHDGRRFVVAKRNVIEQRPWRLLTERELQMTAYLAEGQTLKLIAYQLGVSVGTVAGDLTRARNKLGVSSRLELVRAYREHRKRAAERADRAER